MKVGKLITLDLELVEKLKKEENASKLINDLLTDYYLKTKEPVKVEEKSIFELMQEKEIEEEKKRLKEENERLAEELWNDTVNYWKTHPEEVDEVVNHPRQFSDDVVSLLINLYPDKPWRN